ncbi:aspartate kinase [Fluviispira multicolorata]|uniref:Aspartokinase n=1 Tax=Fluviispira multicolorata TaxID=2654512 RepID=A0A833JBJ5_9BACT|nr:aspartate kinase [Fluviispira multicolorata]KAB8028527.1 aspartate kinase [Fluviispira multicolorata]
MGLNSNEMTKENSDIHIGPVFKFGGTSMGSIERIEHVADLCLRLKPSAIVVSAMAGETNRLVNLAKEISTNIDVPEYDMLVASGEQVSVSLLSLALRKRGIEPAPMLAPKAGILTDSHFSRASILKVNGESIRVAIQKGQLPVIAGFQGVTEDGYLTSLGRGGSDTSAVAITSGIGSKECVIYTDVDGVFTTDPRICPEARIIRKINYEEMLEMASQGSKVLHIRSVQLAAKWGIKLVVKNTFSQDEGTEMIMMDSTLEGEIVSGIASSQSESWIIAGPSQDPKFNLANVFSILAEKNINVDIINQMVNSKGNIFNFTVAQSDSELSLKILKNHFSNIELSANNDVAKISIVGVGMRTHAGVAARMFRCLAENNIEVLLVTTSEIKIGCLIPRNLVNSAVQVLHKEFVSLGL